jgi:hypothetical protein
MVLSRISIFSLWPKIEYQEKWIFKEQKDQVFSKIIVLLFILENFLKIFLTTRNNAASMRFF